jgi:hypothetical protein
MGEEVRLRDVEQADLEMFHEQGRDPEAVRRFVGYWFGRPWWGRGIGARALLPVLGDGEPP